MRCRPLGVVFFSLCALSVPGLASAQQAPGAATSAPASRTVPAIAPGEYTTEGGGGTLVVARKKNTLTFSIESVGANGHTCTLEGELRDGRATLEGMETNAPCVVALAGDIAGINVGASENGACRMYCGARAGFEGLYLKLAAQCTGAAIRKSRDAFKRQYDAKQYADAQRTLGAVLTDCARTLHWLESGRIRNDLAVTLHKLGDLEGCLNMLKPLAEDARGSDDAIREGYPPTDAESYLPIVRATRTNLKLCRGKP